MDLLDRLDDLNAKNIQLVFVHMNDHDTADKYFGQYGLGGAKHISDTDCLLYSQFGLSKGNFSQLFGLKVWVRGYQLRKKELYMSSKKSADSTQMPGIFLISKSKIVDRFIYRSIADKPDYEKFINHFQ